MLFSISSVLSYPVQIDGIVSGSAGAGIPDVKVIIYTSPNSPFAYKTEIVTLADGTFRHEIDVPDDVERGELLVSLADCTFGQIKRLVFNRNKTSHVVKLRPCRDNNVDHCKVKIRAQRLDDGSITLIAQTSGHGTYKYEWSNGSTTQEIVVSELTEYCVVVSDSSGCTARDCTDLSEQDCEVAIQVSRVDASVLQGTVVLHARTTGRPPFTYLWSTGDTTKSIRISEPGRYCVTISDALGCTAESCVDIDPFDHCKTEIQILTDQVANDADSVTLVARTLGRAPFTYRWSTGDTTPTIKVISGGEYCVKVIDAAECSSHDCIDLDRKACDIKIKVKRPHPHADTAAYMLTTRSKGRHPFSYEWSTGDTSSSISVREFGEYCVTLTDAVGCQSRDCVVIGLRDDCKTEIQLVPRHSNDSAAGLALLARTKGRPPFAYSWSTGDTTPIIFPDSLGEYCVEVTDASGCISRDCIDLNQMMDTCRVKIVGNPHGILVAVTPGTPVISYLWNTGATTKSIRVDSSGEYCVTITTLFGCQSTACYTVGEQFDSACTVKIFRRRISVEKIQLFAIARGLGDFEFSWSTGEEGNSIIVDSSGEYCVKARSARCETTDCIKVELDKNTINADGISVVSQGLALGTSRLWPNPFSQGFSISLDADRSESSLVEVLNLSGQVIFRRPWKLYKGQNQLEIRGDNMTPGVYLLRLGTQAQVQTFKIVKKE